MKCPKLVYFLHALGLEEAVSYRGRGHRRHRAYRVWFLIRVLLPFALVL